MKFDELSNEVIGCGPTSLLGERISV